MASSFNVVLTRKVQSNRFRTILAATTAFSGLIACAGLLFWNSQPGSQTPSSISALAPTKLEYDRAYHRPGLFQQLDAGNDTEVTESGDSNATNAEAQEQDEDESEDSCPAVEKKDAFFVKQLFWSWVNTLEVSGVTKFENGSKVVGPLGYIKSEPFSFVSEQAWRGPDGALIASSHQDAITTITNIYVEDCEHSPIATVSEQMAGASSSVSQYTIQNNDGDIVAISTMSRNFGTEVDINDQETGKRLVTVAKGWGQWNDAWAATFRKGVSDRLANDPRVVVMLLSAASSSGTWGLGGPLSLLLSPLWLLMLFCCCCACCTAMSRSQENVHEYDQIHDPMPAPMNGAGHFQGQGVTLGGRNQGDNIVRC